MRTILVIYFYLTLRVTVVKAAPTAEIVLTQLQTFVYDREIVQKFDLQLVPFRGRNMINGSFIFNRSLAKLNWRFLLDFERPDRTRFQMVNYTLDACKLLNGAFHNQRMLRLISENLAKQTEFPRKCPLEANRSYSLLMFDMKIPQFPLPNLKFNITSSMYNEDNTRKTCEIRFKGATKRKA